MSTGAIKYSFNGGYKTESLEPLEYKTKIKGCVRTLTKTDRPRARQRDTYIDGCEC